MADISGVKITDLTSCGTSDDGEHVWITHRLGDGTEYPLIYPFEALGYLITVLTDTARSAQRRRLAHNPHEAVEGADADAMAVATARVGTSPDNAAVILHFTTSDGISMVLELPAAAVQDLIPQLQEVANNLVAPSSRRLH